MGTPIFTGDVFQWARFCNVTPPKKDQLGVPLKRPPVPSTLHQLLALIAVFLYITPFSEFLIDKNLSKRPETFIEPGTS